jgi:hypothetical protein
MLIFLFCIRSSSGQRNYIWLLVVNFIISYQSSAAPEVKLIPAQQQDLFGEQMGCQHKCRCFLAGKKI